MPPPAPRRRGVPLRRTFQKAVSTHADFDVTSFLKSASRGNQILEFKPRETLFGQGDPATRVMYIQEGSVKLSVVNESGKEGVVAILEPGDFAGLGCLAGQTSYVASAIAIAPTLVWGIPKDEMTRVLHGEHEFADRFIAYMLARNLRVEEDLTNQLFNSSEKRLARTLLMLARYGLPEQPLKKTLPRISQETLAEMVGTTRPRINFFMNKFKKLGFIEDDGVIRVNESLLSVVLLD